MTTATHESCIAPQAIDFRIILRNEFVVRFQHNPSYSLRAFARFLEVDQSHLTKILNGVYSPSMKFMQKVGRKLGISPAQISKTAKTNFTPLPDDEFKIISEWFHFAILELAKTKDFKTDV